MTNQNDITLLYICSEIDANVLKEILEDNNIATLIRNDMKSMFLPSRGHIYLGLMQNIGKSIQVRLQL